jgi:hypothetical protein
VEVEAVIMTTSHVPTPVHLLETAVVPGRIWRTVTALITGFVAVGAYYGTWYLTEAIALQELPVAHRRSCPVMAGGSVRWRCCCSRGAP